jgi:hypothetical protein
MTVMAILITVTVYKCWKQNKTINHPTFLLGGEEVTEEEKPENEEELKPNEST